MSALFSLSAALFLLPTTVSAVSLQCDQVVAQGQTFNFKSLGGLKSVHFQEYTAPTIVNTTFTIDLCAPLKKSSDSPSNEQCPTGTRVCGIQRSYKGGKDEGVQRVIPIAGEFVTDHGGHLDPKYTRLKESSSNSDSDLEGVRIELFGGIAEEMGEKLKQKAIVEMVCDKKMTGLEGFEEGKSMTLDYGSMRRRAETAADDDDEKEPELPDLDKGKALQFKGYKLEKDLHTLRLTWRTDRACEDAADSPSGGRKSSGLGFFGWFFTVTFLLIAAYIIFGSWLNYNRYGARGWDLIPHGDTIRDIPYIVKDWTSGLSERMRGGDSRGGYSAV